MRRDYLLSWSCLVCLCPASSIAINRDLIAFTYCNRLFTIHTKIDATMYASFPPLFDPLLKIKYKIQLQRLQLNYAYYMSAQLPWLHAVNNAFASMGVLRQQ